MLNDLYDAAYDKERKRFKNPAIPIFIVMGILIAFCVFGIFAGMPLMLLISVFAVATSIASVLHDHWILNSLVIPFVALFTVIAISDLWHGWLIPNFCYHITVSVCSVIVIVSRAKTSFYLMLFASIFYASWVLTIKLFFDIPAYYMLFWISFDNVTAFIGSLVLCLATSIAATAKNIILKRFGHDVTCKDDGGMCPL